MTSSFFLSSTSSILIAVRDTCVDWSNGTGETSSIEEALASGLKIGSTHGSKKDNHQESTQIRFNKRCVGPSSTQVRVALPDDDELHTVLFSST
jgi:hypothetical protein